MLISFN